MNAMIVVLLLLPVLALVSSLAAWVLYKRWDRRRAIPVVYSMDPRGSLLRCRQVSIQEGGLVTARSPQGQPFTFKPDPSMRINTDKGIAFVVDPTTGTPIQYLGMQVPDSWKGIDGYYNHAALKDIRVRQMARAAQNKDDLIMKLLPYGMLFLCIMMVVVVGMIWSILGKIQPGQQQPAAVGIGLIRMMFLGWWP